MRAKGFVPSGVILRNRIILVIMLIIAIISLRFLYSYGRDKALNTIPKDGKLKFTVQFCSADLIQNSSVGNNWSFQANVNGKKIKEGRKINITTTINDKLSFTGNAKERDLVSDVGSASISVIIKDLKLPEKNTYFIDVTVAENRGKYLGNTALWKFNFSVIRKVSLLDIINNIF